MRERKNNLKKIAKKLLDAYKPAKFRNFFCLLFYWDVSGRYLNRCKFRYEFIGEGLESTQDQLRVD